MRAPLLALAALLAFAPAADAGILKFDTNQAKISYEAAPGEVNRVTVTQDGSTVRIVDTGAAITVQRSNACTAVSSSEATCTLPSSSYIVKTVTGDLADEITHSAQIPGQLDGGDGDDVLVGGPADDSLFGLAGADVLDGRGGVDEYDAGAGDDRILARDGVVESVVCGFGADGGEADVEETLDRNCEAIDKALFTPTLSDEPTTAGDGGASGGGGPAGSVAGDASGDGVVDNEDLVGADPAALAALPVPAPGRSVSAAPGSGKVLVRKPGASRFLPLDPAKAVPVGSVVDARRGSVTVVAAKNLTGATQRATFTGGLFRVTQRRSVKAMTTVLTIRGTLECGSNRTVARSAAVKRKRSRKLWGSGHGRFTTRGRNATASVRGTIWGVTDRCDGTLTQVKRGAVAVKDRRTGKTRLIRAGGRYLARNRTSFAR